ncbi:MAG: OmpA family protein [Myxococcaceae bacterium]
MRAFALALVVGLSLPSWAQDDAEEEAEPELSAEESAPPAVSEFPRVHLSGGGVADALSKQIGFELSVSYGASRYLDVGLGVDFGASIGAVALAELHTAWSREAQLRPFGQLRAMFHPGSGGYGAGVWAGGSAELGPGRAKLGPGAMLFAPQAGYHSLAVLAVLAYELDVVRPATSTVVERIVVKETVRELTAPPLPPDAATHPTGRVSGRLVDLGGRPLSGLVRFVSSGKQYEASPDFDVELKPGEHVVEAEVPGFLIRGRKLTVSAGENSNCDFILRPIPRVKVAELRPEQVSITQQIQFESAKAEILEESYFILDEVTDILLRNPQIQQLRIEGHTDDVGGAEFNEELSTQRALSVSRYLSDRGVDPTRLQGQGFGLTKPLASNKTEAGRKKNRRVQFRIVAP